MAFSNAKGGTVYVGVNDGGEVKGLQIGKETIQNWINEVKTKTAPQIIPDVEVLTIENKTVVTLSAMEYPIKPVSKSGRYYKRIANANHVMSIEEIANEHLKTINTSWDFYPDPNHSLKDISLEKVARFIKNIEQRSQSNIEMSGLDFLEKIEIIRNDQLTFGGYLLFVNDYCLISDVQVGRFKSEITIIDSISLNSDLFTETDEIIDFIKKHLMVEYIISGEPQRTERFDYPLDAIREIVINMIVHRDYRDSSGSIIKIFDDRIEFFNPGNLYGGITIEDLLSGYYTSKSRNKLVAKAFKETGLIERYGSGIMRVRKICKDYDIKEPVFKEVSHGFLVILYKESINATRKIEILETDLKSDLKTDLKTDLKINSLEEQIIAIIEADNKISIPKIAQELGKGITGTKKYIANLKADNRLKRIGPDKGGHWEILPHQ